MAGEFLRQILENQRRLADQFSGTQAAVSTLNEQSRQDRQALEQNTATRGGLATARAALDALAELQTAEENRRAASAFGVNMDDPNSVVVQTAEIARMATERANMNAAEVERKRNMPVMENPLAAIGALFTLPGNEREVARNSQVALSAAQRLNALNQAAQVQMRTNEALKRNITQEAVQMRTDEAFAAAQEAMIKLRDSHNRQNAQDLLGILRLDADRVSMLVSMQNLTNQAEQIDMARQQFALARQEREDRIRKNQQEEAQETEFIDTVNAGRKIYGLPPMTRSELINYERLGGERKALIGRFYDSGALQKATGIQNIATTPAAAGVLLNQAGVRYAEGHPSKPLQDLIADGERAFRETPLGKTATKPEEILAGTNAAIAARVAEQARFIKANDLTNIYSAVPFGTLANASAVQATAIYAPLIKPMQEAGVVDVPPHQLFSQVAQLVAAGKLSIEAASQSIADYHKTAIAINNGVRNYKGHGLPAQASYRTNIAISPAGQEAVVDLSNATEVQSALIQFQTNQRLREVSQQLPIGLGLGR